MLSYGLKMYNMDDMEEGRAIINAFKKVEFEQEYASKGGGSASTGSSPTGKPTAGKSSAGKSTAGTSTKRSSKN
ncbi:hypothetical protein O6H91_02G105700 [Diphasiastrum complanatum]|nr:hypothetical protein O6H91_02G105700 [Diphasiastrum complanatum]